MDPGIVNSTCLQSGESTIGKRVVGSTIVPDGVYLNYINRLTYYVLDMYYTLYQYCNQLDLIAVALAVVAAVFNGLLTPGFTILIGRLYNGFAQYSAGVLSSDDLSSLINRYCLVIVAIGVGALFLGWLSMSLWLIFASRIAYYARERAYTFLIAQNASWYAALDGNATSQVIKINR